MRWLLGVMGVVLRGEIISVTVFRRNHLQEKEEVEEENRVTVGSKVG